MSRKDLTEVATHLGSNATMTSQIGIMKDAIKPGIGRNANKVKHRGILTTVKDDMSFGFIKPHHSLPEEFTNKHVYFKPHGIRFQEGDEVEFTLREEDKTRPNASRVWLINRIRPHIKHAMEGYQSSRTLGTIIQLADGEGWIKVVGDMLEGIQDKDLGKIYFAESWVACAHIDLLQGDMVEFNASQSKRGRSNKLSAYKIKLVECRERTCEDVKKYLQKITMQISKWGDAEIDLLSGVLSCEAIWMAIGHCRDLSSEVLMRIIDFTELLKKKSQGRNETFKRGMKALACSGFCDSLMLFVQTYFQQEQEETQNKVQQFLLRILDNVPEKSRLVLQVIKLMLPSEDKSLDHFMFKALKMLVPESRNDISDLNWSELSLVPNTSELLGNQKALTAQLREVRVKGAYEAVEEYMDIYFRLLRADCFSGLQAGIQSYLSHSLDPRDMFLYTGVTLVGYHFLTSGNGVALKLKVTPYQHVENWATCSNLRFGNLLCLSPSGTFNDVIWATVADRDEKVSKKDGTVWVELCDGCNMQTTSCLIHINKASGRIIMAESPTYYKAYQPILRALQDINPEDLSFQEELVHMKPPQQVSYATELESIDAPITMDPSQKAAFRQALQQRVAIIQGPPGTGKTFLGIKIVEALLRSTSVQLPILVLTYKNHALDEFLKGLVGTLPDGVVRIGGRCQDKEVGALNLQKLKRSTARSVLNQKLQSESQREKSQLEGLVKEAVQQLIQSKKFSLKALLNGFTENQIETLLLRCKGTIQEKSLAPMQARDVLPIWNEEKDYLLDKHTPFSERCSKTSSVLLKFLDAALKQWMPAKEQVSQIIQPIPNFEVKQMELPKKLKTASAQDADVVEKDIIDVEKERTTAWGKSHAYTMDIDVMKEMHKKSDLLEMAPSAQILANEIPLLAIHQIQDLWSLTPDKKMVVVQVLLWHHSLEAETDLETVFKRYREACLWHQEVENEHKLSILKQKAVVGMTITGASIHLSLLKMLQPAIVLVEEAAEVLEPQIAAVLGNSVVEHLILIGDHKQLRPKVESYNLCQKYHFDTSMMERLINNGYPRAVLKLQNRMLPEMADLLLDIYPDLESNLEIVKDNKPPNFTSPMFFWCHDDPEEVGRSYCNTKEAERVLKLALFFMQMGYRPGQITILAGYQGQVRLLRNMLKKAETDHADIFTKYQTRRVEHYDDEEENDKPVSVAIHTIDMYQGDENDIIIISLVRSNESGQIGFLKLLNRRCVAQSRARCGMYIVGNDKTFLNTKGSCWIPLINSLHKKELVGKQFPLNCPIHKGMTEIRATTAEDIPLDQICKVKCYVLMDCGIHLCPKPCRPPHTHRRADCKKIVDFVLPCNHLGQRQCRQEEETIVCQVNCTQMMLCEKHPCKKLCQPVHSHSASLCRASVDFIFKECHHQAKKNCGQMESDIECLRKVKFKFSKCEHDGARKCIQKEEEILCPQRCIRKLTCGHPCAGLCGNVCDPSQCKICKKKRKYERKQQKKAEEKARNQARKAAESELNYFIAQNPVPEYCRVNITQDGDCASEYFSVVDRVIKYIQPGHGWFPKVTRIEKITNHNLQREWIRAKSKMIDPLRTELKFHGTSQAAIKDICKNGFKLPRSKKRKGMYGNGIYFATDSSKSAQNRYTEGSNMLLLCEILIGQAYTAQTADPDLCLQKLQILQCDSVFAPRGTRGAGGVLYDEYIIFRTEQALPRYVVHFSTCGVERIPELPGSKERYLLVPKREFDDNDPLDNHFRLAESQFLRLTKSAGSDDTIKSVELFLNAEIAERFTEKKKEFEKRYPKQPESKSVLAFHGTHEKNIEDIMQHNFSMDRCQRGAYGAGIYLSEFPDISKDYACGANKLILCKVLPGKAYSKGISQSSLEPGYDSHSVKRDSQGRAWAHVIFNPDQIHPIYVITY